MAKYIETYSDDWDEPELDYTADSELNLENALGLILDRPVSAWRRIEQWKEERQLKNLLREVYDE